MPNVVVFMSDEHSPFISSVYGHPFVHTPNMERLAQLGTVFENAYAPSPLCLPSRSAFMTGRPVHQIQTYNNCKVIPFAHRSYGEVLAEQGVHTAYIGNGAALYCDPQDLGFTEMILAGKRKPSLDTSFRRNPLPIRGENVLNRGFGPREDAWESEVRKVDAAVRWLLETAPTLNGPWTLTVNVSKPHFPLYATPELWERYEGFGDLPRYGTDQESANHPYAKDLRMQFRTDEFTEAQIRGMRQGYYACVSYVDRELGRLMDALNASGQADDTVVVYTSDHGEMLGELGLWWKSTLYERSARVPLIAAGAGFKPGARTSTPVSLLDLQAALFHAVDKRRPEAWWGTPLQSIPTSDPERVVFSEYHGHGVRSGAFMIRRGDWKLIYNMAAPHQLFNLREDPNELTNVWANHPKVGRSLVRDLYAICDPEVENENAHRFEERQLRVIEELKARYEPS